MDIRDYEYIVAIAEQGNISRAAGQLFITQSALTKFLQRTERDLGVSLFLRKGNQFFLTEAGQQYVEIGRVIMNLDRQLMDKLTTEHMTQKSRIRIGFGMGRIQDFMQNVIPAFRRLYPDIMISARADTSRRNKMALQNGELDMAVLTNTEKLPGYQYTSVGQSWMAVVTRDDSPLAAQSRLEEGYPYPVIPVHLLNGQNFITLQSHTNSGNLVREIWKKYNIQANTVLEVSDIRSLVDAVEEGFGIAMMMSVPTNHSHICYMSLEGVEIPSQTVELVYRSDIVLTKPMKELIQIITSLDYGFRL